MVAYTRRGKSKKGKKIEFDLKWIIMKNKKAPKIVGLITARKGSKRLLNKNTRMMYKKPMISYTIDEALKSKYIDKIIITTDDEKVKKIVDNYKENSKNRIEIIDRPLHLATDDARTLPVLVHALKSTKDVFDVAVLLQPTSPLRTVEHIDKCIQIFLKENCTSLVTVKEFEPFDIFVPNGAIFITSGDTITKDNKLRDKNVRLVVMSQESSVDIDTEIDFMVAEHILRRKYGDNRE